MVNCLKLPSPNYFKPADMDTNVIQAVVLHGTSGPLQSSLDWLRNPRIDNPGAAVSANYVISRAGIIYELVEWERGLRAYANGIVEHSDRSIAWLETAKILRHNPNWITVSIEHEATGAAMRARAAMTDAQFNSSIEVTAYILKSAGLKANHQTVIGHNQISGTLKYNCPGVIFPPAYTEVLIKRHPELG